MEGIVPGFMYLIKLFPIFYASDEYVTIEVKIGLFNKKYRIFNIDKKIKWERDGVDIDGVVVSFSIMGILSV